jgi:uncharacterized protein (DUF488 family)
MNFLKQAGTCSKLKLAKIFFLMEREGKLGANFKFYSFVPYKFGPYSFELFHDIELFEKNGNFTTDGKNITYLEGNAAISSELSGVIKYYLKKNIKLNDKNLMNYVYNNYPDYTIFSEIQRKKKYCRDRTGVYTIGYEGLSIDEFLLKLIREQIEVLVDVRHNPWSMKFGFTKNTLRSFCSKLGIEYQNVRELGIPGSFRKNLKTKQDYEALFSQYKTVIIKKKSELEMLKSIALEKRIALVCFEKDPDYCHRTIIASELDKMGAEVDIN